MFKDLSRKAQLSIYTEMREDDQRRILLWKERRDRAFAQHLVKTAGLKFGGKKITNNDLDRLTWSQIKWAIRAAAALHDERAQNMI